MPPKTATQRPWLARRRLRLAALAAAMLSAYWFVDGLLTGSPVYAACWWSTFAVLCMLVLFGTLIDVRMKSVRWMVANRICPACNYRLGKIPSNICPECGTDIDSAGAGKS